MKKKLTNFLEFLNESILMIILVMIVTVTGLIGLELTPEVKPTLQNNTGVLGEVAKEVSIQPLVDRRISFKELTSEQYVFEINAKSSNKQLMHIANITNSTEEIKKVTLTFSVPREYTGKASYLISDNISPFTTITTSEELKLLPNSRIKLSMKIIPRQLEVGQDLRAFLNLQIN